MTSRGVFWAILFLAGCKAPAGVDGLDGDPGADGEDGADGQPGSDGTDGTDGADGFGAHFGTGPWGISLILDDVVGGTGAGGALLPGDTLTVLFRVEDEDGIPYQLGELRGLEFQLAGPSDHMQVVLDRAAFGSPLEDSVWNPGTQQYALALQTAIPAAYLPPANDTPDFGEGDGDWGGLPLVDGTYRLAGWASIRHTWTDGTTWTEAGNTATELLLGTATALEPREVVDPASCVDCHGETLYSHGGSRTTVEVCTVCHVAGSEDRLSATNPLTTPGASVAFDSMIHGIHMGADRPDPLVLNGFPANPALPGYPDYNAHDYSEVHYPIWPTGVANCDSCHAGAAQGDVETRPSTLACVGCHSDSDIRGGTNHSAAPQPDDSACAGCHPPADILANHADLRGDPAVNGGITVSLVGVTGGTGPGGAFQVGDSVEVEFAIDDDSATLITLPSLRLAEVTMAGPLEHVQRILVNPQDGVVNNAVLDTVTNTYRYTLGTIPATYPAQPNDTADLGIESGDWLGLPLVDGTYRVAVMASIEVSDGVDTVTVGHHDTQDVLLGAATTLTTRAVIDEAACETCHASIEFHGGMRTGTDACVTCHTAGSEDRYSATDPLTTPGATVDWQTMVHKMHNGSNLDQTYSLNGFGFPYTTHNYNHVVFSRFDGGTAQCSACHASSNAWQTPSTLACTSCHDSSATLAHAALNTDSLFGEACEVCHGVGSSQAVEQAHAWGVAQ